MNPEELKIVLEEHAKWLKGNGGKQANLQGSNLQRANLRHSNLQEANLKGSDLRHANLQEADLENANLQGANLKDSILPFANLQDAAIAGVKWPFEFDLDPTLARRVAEAANKHGALKMDKWHTCETTHCLAGWAVTLHPQGKEIESKSSTLLAGRLLLPEAEGLWFASNEKALEWCKQILEKENTK